MRPGGRAACSPSEGPTGSPTSSAWACASTASRPARYRLGREGGHGRRRILHAGGAATGAAIAEALIAQVAADPRIEVLEHTAAIALAGDDDGCAGAWLLGHDELRPRRAPA